MESERSRDDEPLTPAERQFLLDSGVPANAFDREAKEAARARLRARAEQTRRNASAELTAAQVAGLLDCPTSQVFDWAELRYLYAFESSEGLRFPEWQFPDGQRLPGLDAVLRELRPGMHPYSVEGLLARVPHEQLDEMTAVDWLARGGATGPVVALVVSSAYDP